jgi:hypothetical protein
MTYQLNLGVAAILATMGERRLSRGSQMVDKEGMGDTGFEPVTPY